METPQVLAHPFIIGTCPEPRAEQGSDIQGGKRKRSGSNAAAKRGRKLRNHRGTISGLQAGIETSQPRKLPILQQETALTCAPPMGPKFNRVPSPCQEHAVKARER
ncbi:hypothetical protein U1Q18_049301 [Sarracenia purpurea var. burkii]